MWMFLGLMAVIAVSLSTGHRCASVECSSWGYRYNSCRVPGAGLINSVTVARKYSKSACIYGSSYGKGTGSIWVNKGCRGKFDVCFSQTVNCRKLDCSSWDYKFALCPVPGARDVTSVTVARKYSKSSCDFGHGFGKDRGAIWVHHGCRANFRVCST